MGNSGEIKLEVLSPIEHNETTVTPWGMVQIKTMTKEEAIKLYPDRADEIKNLNTEIMVCENV